MSHSALRAVLAFSFTVLTACGGGGGSSGDEEARSSSSGNVFSATQGRYVVSCDDRSGGGHLWSLDGSVTVGELIGKDRVKITATRSDYEDAVQPDPSSLGFIKVEQGSDRCDRTYLTKEVTITGEIRDLGATKTYVLNGRSVVAKVVEFTYTGVTFHKGSFEGSLPMPGVTIKMAYVHDGQRLYLSTYRRDADGVGSKLTRLFGVKQ